MTRSRLLPRAAFLIPLLFVVLGVAAFGTACESEEARNARLTRDMESPTPVEQKGSDKGSDGATVEDVEAWLGSYVREHGGDAAPPALSTTVPEKQWRLTFPDRLVEGAPMQVEIAVHPAMTVLMAPLVVLPAHTPRELVVALMVKNYELYQSKLSISPDGRLFASYEVPNRLLDRRELLENIEDLTVLGRDISAAVSASLSELAQPPLQPLPHAAVPAE